MNLSARVIVLAGALATSSLVGCDGNSTPVPQTQEDVKAKKTSLSDLLPERYHRIFGMSEQSATRYLQSQGASAARIVEPNWVQANMDVRDITDLLGISPATTQLVEYFPNIASQDPCLAMTLSGYSQAETKELHQKGTAKLSTTLGKKSSSGWEIRPKHQVTFDARPEEGIIIYSITHEATADQSGTVVTSSKSDVSLTDLLPERYSHIFGMNEKEAVQYLNMDKKRFIPAKINDPNHVIGIIDAQDISDKLGIPVGVSQAIEYFPNAKDNEPCFTIWFNDYGAAGHEKDEEYARRAIANLSVKLGKPKGGPLDAEWQLPSFRVVFKLHKLMQYSIIRSPDKKQELDLSRPENPVKYVMRDMEKCSRDELLERAKAYFTDGLFENEKKYGKPASARDIEFLRETKWEISRIDQESPTKATVIVRQYHSGTKSIKYITYNTISINGKWLLTFTDTK